MTNQINQSYSEMDKDSLLNLFSSYEGCAAYDQLPQYLKEDREIIKKVLEHRFYLLRQEWYTKKYRYDKELALLVVSIYGNMFKHVSDELKHDREVLITALSTTSQFFWHIPEHFKQDRDIVLLALKNDNYCNVYDQLHSKFQNDMKLITEAISFNMNLIRGLPEHFYNNPRFMYDIIKSAENPQSPISYLGDELKEKIYQFINKEELQKLKSQTNEKESYLYYLEKIIFNDKLNTSLEKQVFISKSKL